MAKVIPTAERIKKGARPDRKSAECPCANRTWLDGFELHRQCERPATPGA